MTPEQLLIKGKLLSVYYGEGNPNNKIVSIRAIVDGELVVYKRWSPVKKYWIYDTWNIYFFELMLKFNEESIFEYKGLML